MALRTLSLSLALVTLVAACKPAPKSGEASTQGSSQYTPVEIRFTDPGNGGSSVLAYAKRERILERELAKVNATLVWVPGAAAFSANFEAMNAGAINAGGGAISPIIGALGHNLQFRIYGIGDPVALRQAGVIVRPDSGIKSLKDLAGRRVAVNWAAHGDYILLRALEKNGVPADSVTRVAVQPPDAAAAFASGKIDAWSTFGVFYSTAVRNGARVLVTEAEIDSDDVSVYSANASVLQKNPAAFQTILRVVNQLVGLAHERPELFQNVFTDKGPTALAGDELRIAVENTRSLSTVRIPTPADRRRIAAVTHLLFVNHSIDRDIGIEESLFDLDAALRAPEARR